LDSFNRANGSLGAGWSGSTGGYALASNAVDVGGGNDVYWMSSSFGADQEAYVTLTTIDPAAGEMDLLLKSQSNGWWGAGLIEVLYEPVNHRVQVWTFATSQGWVQRGADIPVTFVNGDRFGARVTVGGTVTVYRNGNELGSRSVAGWPYVASGGYVGLWMSGASNAMFDDFGGGTVASGPTPTPTPTPTPGPDAIFADGFESGSLSAWSSSVTDSADLSVTSNAALSGLRGMQALIDSNGAIYVTDATPNAEARYRVRFAFDPNSITMASGNAHYILYGYSGASTIVVRVELRFASGAYGLRVALANDAGTWTQSGWVTIADAPHSLELDWRAASASGAFDGGLTFWLDGVQVANLATIDNDTLRIDQVWLGAVAGIDTGTRGTYYFDAVESRRTTYIGPVVP